MKLVSAGNQQVRHPLFDASGTIITGGTAQLLLAQSQARSLLTIQNISAGLLTVEFGSARATASLTSGAVSSCAVTNVGFNFSKAPVVRFLGGGFAGNSSYLGLNQPNGAAPNSMSGLSGRPAQGRAVMTGSPGNLALASITIDDGGAGYAIAPYVFLFNDDLDPYGVALPSATVGIQLQPEGSLTFESTACTTDAVSIWGATTGQAFVAKWMD